MYTVRILLGIVCLVDACSNRMPDGNLLTSREASKLSTAQQKVQSPSLLHPKRKRLIAIATSQVGLGEVGANNYGPVVKKYLAQVGLKEGAPWCAAFVSWVFAQVGYDEPRTAWSPSLFPRSRRVSLPEPADVIGIYYASYKRIAHCGILESKKDTWLITIEGNTSVAGSRDGDGVQRKRRHIKTIAQFADWVEKKGGSND